MVSKYYQILITPVFSGGPNILSECPKSPFESLDCLPECLDSLNSLLECLGSLFLCRDSLPECLDSLDSLSKSLYCLNV